MALADYRLCDQCGGKAFYDANLNYDFKPSPDKTVVRDTHYHLDFLGDWAVLCEDCAKTHRVVIEKINRAEDP